jgi:hypothetical protein
LIVGVKVIGSSKWSAVLNLFSNTFSKARNSDSLRNRWEREVNNEVKKSNFEEHFSMVEKVGSFLFFLFTLPF